MPHEKRSEPAQLMSSGAVLLHTSVYVSIRQHSDQMISAGAIFLHTSAYVSIRQHTSAYVSKRQHTSAYVSIRQLMSSGAVLLCRDSLCQRTLAGVCGRMLTYAVVCWRMTLALWFCAVTRSAVRAMPCINSLTCLE